MKIQLLLIELLIGSMIIGGLIAHKKSVGERLLLFLSIPLSFGLAFIPTKLGLFDGIGALFSDLVLQFNFVNQYLEGSMSATTSIASIIAVILRPLIMTLVFWILLVIFKIIITLIVKKRNTGIFEKPTEAKNKKNVLAILLGVAGAFVIVMFSCLPVDFVSNLIEPSVNKAREKNYTGTNIHEITTYIDKTYMPVSKTEFFGKVQQVTGIKALLTAVSNSLSETTLVTNGGKELRFNASTLAQDLLCDEVDVIALWEHLHSPVERSGEELKHVSNVVDTLVDSPVVLAVFPEILHSIELNDEYANRFIEVAAKKYSSDDMSVLSEDLNNISKAVKAIAKGAKNDKLKEGTAHLVILRSISNKEVSDEVSDSLFNLSTHHGSLDIVTEYGINFVCDALAIEDKERMFSLIHHTEVCDEDDEAAFSKLISSASELAVKFYEAEDKNVLVVFENFALLGRIFDGLYEFEPTTEIPEKILLTIADAPEYKNLFVKNSAERIIRNVKEGNSTYEEFFASIQAIYNIIKHVAGSK